MNRTVTTINFLSFVCFFLVAMSNAQEPANISTDISDPGSLGPWESPDLDNVEMGSAAISALIPEGTGFTIDFEGAWPDTTWNSSQQYSLNQSDGVLEVAVDKFEPWITYQYKFSGVYDVSGNPYLSVLVKADRPLVLWARIWEGTRSVARKVRVYETAGFTKYCFDFADSGNVFLGEVRMIEFGVNEDATGFNGILWMDDIKFGTDAARFASLAGINKQTYYIDSKGNSMLITDVENAVSLSTAGAESLIENISFAQEGSEAFRMSFDCIDDASGTAILTVTANGADGWGDNTVRFELTVAGNEPPVMDQVENMEIKAGEDYSIRISGIGDGDIPVEQNIEISASSNNTRVIDTAYSIYDAGPYASILFTPSDSGLTTISIMLDDGEAVNNTTSMEFDVRSYLNLNSAPTVDTPEDLVIAPDAGEQVITLTGISDGDGNVQTLTITAVSSADTIVAAPSVEYSGGGAALLRLTPNPATTGISTISVTVSDDGGSDTNNGDLDTEVSFKVETLFLNKKGYVVPLTQADRGMWYFENEGAAYNVTFDNSGEFETMEITMTGKSTWDGMWLTLPEELNLSEHPYISYEIYSAGQPTYHWNYFYNNPPDRNEKNSREHMYMVPANEWTLLSFDYSDPGDMQTNEAEEINGERIKAVLFNLHDSPGSWPFTAIDGEVHYRNIRIGDSAIVTGKIPGATIDGVPDQVHYAGSGDHSITLPGISDGLGGTASVTASSSNLDIVPDPTIGEVVDGTATLTYSIGAQMGGSEITLTVSAEGSTEKRITFDIYVNEEDIAQSATVTIDRYQTFQEIEGLGVHWLNADQVDMFINDLGGSVLRYWQISNILEPVNDNDDPYVLNRDALDYGALDVDLINRLTEAGMERFIFTIFTPPAWMKRNLSTNAREGAPQYANTDNILESYYFEEFAEHMVAWITLFKEECGVDLYAVGLQNEPAFNPKIGFVVNNHVDK